MTSQAGQNPPAVVSLPDAVEEKLGALRQCPFQSGAFVAVAQKFKEARHLPLVQQAADFRDSFYLFLWAGDSFGVAEN